MILVVDSLVEKLLIGFFGTGSQMMVGVADSSHIACSRGGRRQLAAGQPTL